MILDAIVKNKRKEVELRKGELPVCEKSRRHYSGGLIAEIKRKSPSENMIGEVDPAKQAALYERGGASAISVLCDEKYFGGSLDDLEAVAARVEIPVLCKDFIVDEFQIYEARSKGADIILLIVAVLSDEELVEFKKAADSLGMQSIFEVHDEDELERALESGAEIVGINNRNLKDFSIDLGLSAKLAAKIPDGVLKIAESGIYDFDDVPSGVDGILVGTSIMRSPFVYLKIKELLGRPLLKTCGIRTVEDARICEELDVDMVGLNFVPSSKRFISDATAVRAELKNCKVVGVFKDQSLDEVNRIAEKYDLDLIQLSGSEDYASQCVRPVIKGMQVREVKPKEVSFGLVDGRVPGSGERVEYDGLQTGLMIAGGLNAENLEQVISEYKPLGVDVASGIETDGKVDQEKIKRIVRIVNQVKYVS